MHKMAKTWWGRRFLEGVKPYTEQGRLTRGRQYLANNRILKWNVNGNEIHAFIRGKANPYHLAQETPIYDVRLEFLKIRDEDWNKALDLIGSRAGYISRLLFNEMPDELETPLAELGISLLPTHREDMKSSCSCPDQDLPCKHIAALYFLLASNLDHDPFLLFELRGLSRSDLITRLKSSKLGAALASALDESNPAPEPASSFFTRPQIQDTLSDQISTRDFWRGKFKIPAFTDAPTSASVPGILIRKGGDFPAFWPKDESFVEVMDDFYSEVRKGGKSSLK